MFFEKKVDLRSRNAMEGFLIDHFRYPTMNYCNKSTSYANNVKIYKLGLSADIMDKAYDVIGHDFAFHDINYLIHDFEMLHDFEWQVGFNGRSSGYMVLYRGGYNIKERGDGTTYFAPYIKPGLGVDELLEDTFCDWSMDDLRERVRLICEFDRLCDECRNVFIENCKYYDGDEE